MIVPPKTLLHIICHEGWNKNLENTILQNAKFQYSTRGWAARDRRLRYRTATDRTDNYQSGNRANFFPGFILLIFSLEQMSQFQSLVISLVTQHIIYYFIIA